MAARCTLWRSDREAEDWAAAVEKAGAAQRQRKQLGWEAVKVEEAAAGSGLAAAAAAAVALAAAETEVGGVVTARAVTAKAAEVKADWGSAVGEGAEVAREAVGPEVGEGAEGEAVAMAEVKMQSRNP